MQLNQNHFSFANKITIILYGGCK